MGKEDIAFMMAEAAAALDWATRRGCGMDNETIVTTKAVVDSLYTAAQTIDPGCLGGKVK